MVEGGGKGSGYAASGTETVITTSITEFLRNRHASNVENFIWARNIATRKIIRRGQIICRNLFVIPKTITPN